MLLKAYFDKRRATDKVPDQIVGQEEGTLRRFVEACGDRPVDTYGRGDVTAFLDLLRQMPALYGRSPKDKDLTLQQLVDRAEEEQAKRLAEKTVKRHLSALSVFFKHAVDKGYLTVAARAEMVDDRSFRTDVGARDQRDAWTSEELKKLFASPVWTGRHRTFRSQAGPEIIRDAFFWLPLLALYHGARLEEFADLYRRDLIKDGARPGPSRSSPPPRMP